MGSDRRQSDLVSVGFLPSFSHELVQLVRRTLGEGLDRKRPFGQPPPDSGVARWNPFADALCPLLLLPVLSASLRIDP
jgi:hypothetical protein